MSTAAPHIAVIGGGPMGLACAHHLGRQGARVTLFEAGPVLGGMSAVFDFGGLPIERFFHFLCRTDHDYVALLEELGIADRLHWRQTRMGFFCNGRLHEWGNPAALLAFPHISLLTKLRYGLHVLATRRRHHFDDLEHRRADAWLRRWLGEAGYRTLWQPLLALKFYQHHENLSAAWIAARIQRVAQSRSGLLHEELGHLDGCTQTLIDALTESIVAAGGQLQTHTPVQRVVTRDGRVSGVETAAGTVAVDRIISTVPLPLVPDMIPDLPAMQRDNIRAMDNIGVSTVILKLRQPLTPYFWTNISDADIAIPGIIEYSNLNPLQPAILYVPYYMPQTHEKYRWTLAQFLDELRPILQRINPAFTPDWILDSHLSRYHYAQPVCTPGFASRIPPMSGLIPGLLLADTTAYYPQDRCINDSVRIGRLLAAQAMAAC